MNAFVQHFGFEFRTGIRNKQLLMLNYLFPLGFFVMMAFIMTEINPLFGDVLIPAMIIFSVLSVTFLGMPEPLVNARENGIYRSYRINGVPALSILVMPALTAMMHATIVSAIIVVAGYFIFDAPLPRYWGAFILVFFALVVACCGLCVLIGVISPNSRMTILWSQLIFTPSMLLGGMMMPYDMLPVAAQKIAQLLPATHAMNAFRSLGMGWTAASAPWYAIAGLFATGVIGFILAIILFSWDSKNAARRISPAIAVLILLPFVAGIVTSSFDLPQPRRWMKSPEVVQIYKVAMPAIESTGEVQSEPGD